jgi:hypothetical protein
MSAIEPLKKKYTIVKRRLNIAETNAWVILILRRVLKLTGFSIFCHFLNSGTLRVTLPGRAALRDHNTSD